MTYSPAPEVLERFTKMRDNVVKTFRSDIKDYARIFKRDCWKQDFDEECFKSCLLDYIHPQLELIEYLEKTYNIPECDKKFTKMPKYVPEMWEYIESTLHKDESTTRIAIST
tara:strand:- start:185 stop:520 length:336 start_codon:yes stop_codon:yes gene_type:complete